MRRVAAMVRPIVALVTAAALSACGSRPPTPEWQMQAHGAMARYEQAFLTGADRAAGAEFARARGALASTGRADLVARAELVRCALQVASLAGTACDGFEVLRADAAGPERAYAAYLTGAALPAEQAALLPPSHRGVAAAGGGGGAAALARIDEPLSRLVAAGVLVRADRGSPEILRIAADTASQQGWRRPLLAWLGAQALFAERAGDADEARRLRRRMDLVGDAPR